MKAQIWNFHDWIEDTDPKTLFMRFDTMLHNAGFHVLRCCEHHFNPIGYTCLFLLGESHFAIHTFPEEGKTYLELSSCVDRQFRKFMELMDNG